MDYQNFYQKGFFKENDSKFNRILIFEKFFEKFQKQKKPQFLNSFKIPKIHGQSTLPPNSLPLVLPKFYP